MITGNPTSIETAWERVRDLAERYNQLIKDGKTQQFNETDVDSKLILPFIETLGWDIKNTDEVKEKNTDRPSLILTTTRSSENANAKHQHRPDKPPGNFNIVVRGWDLNLKGFTCNGQDKSTVLLSHISQTYNLAKYKP